MEGCFVRSEEEEWNEATYQQPLGAAACCSCVLLTGRSSDDVITFEGRQTLLLFSSSYLGAV